MKICKWFLSSKLFGQKKNNRSIDDKKEQHTRAHCSTQTKHTEETKKRRRKNQSKRISNEEKKMQYREQSSLLTLNMKQFARSRCRRYRALVILIEWIWPHWIQVALGKKNSEHSYPECLLEVSLTFIWAISSNGANVNGTRNKSAGWAHLNISEEIVAASRPMIESVLWVQKRDSILHLHNSRVVNIGNRLNGEWTTGNHSNRNESTVCEIRNEERNRGLIQAWWCLPDQAMKSDLVGAC